MIGAIEADGYGVSYEVPEGDCSCTRPCCIELEIYDPRIGWRDSHITVKQVIY